MFEVRSRKIEELIKVKLSSLLLKDLKDPRLDTFITILNVSLSKDESTEETVRLVHRLGESERSENDL
jgi:ribosome-binding factor A